MKLLCGFYTPVAGQILVDGVRLDRMDLAQWRTRIAAGFQDFVRYEFVAREVVGVGDLPRVADIRAVLDALERGQVEDPARRTAEWTRPSSSAAATPTASNRPSGSGQKLALGWAFMRDDPLLVVLDEPTAALDAEAEHRLFVQYAREAARTARRTGAVTSLLAPVLYCPDGRPHRLLRRRMAGSLRPATMPGL